MTGYRGTISAGRSPAVVTIAVMMMLALLHGFDGLAWGRTSRVFVRDSAIATEKFPLIDRLESMGEWNNAADLLQEILEKYADRVVPMKSDEPAGARRYTSVAAEVRKRIGHWPPAGIAAYRARFESNARSMLTGIDDEQTGRLATVFNRYFKTLAGREAGLRMIDEAFREGQLRAAATIADELLDASSAVDEDRPALLYRAALIHALLDEPEAAATYRRILSEQFPDAVGIIRGESVRYSAALEEADVQPLAEASRLSPDEWPILGGDDSRGRVSSGSGRMGAALWRFDLFPHSTKPASSRIANESATQIKTLAAEQGAAIGIVPVVKDDTVYFQNGWKVFALRLSSGQPVPSWTNWIGERQSKVSAANIATLPIGEQLNVTVTDQQVLAVVRHETPQPVSLILASESDWQLVCLDRIDGRTLWSVDGERLGAADSSLRGVRLAGSPLVAAGRVYLLGRSAAGQQFEDSYVVALNIDDGSVLWSTHLATTENSSFGGWLGNDANFVAASSRMSHLAHAGGRIFAASNTGAVAALNAISGEVAWLRIDDSSGNPEPRTRRILPAQAVTLPRPWSFDPVIADQHRLFTLASDSGDLMVFDAQTGDLLRRIAANDIADADTLIGVDGTSVFLSGSFSVVSIDWQRYDAAAFASGDRSSVQWVSNFPDHGDLASPIRGRSFLTGDSVFVPTLRGVYRIDRKTGRRVEQYPAHGQGAWPEGEGAGNLLVTSDRVIVASAEGLRVYADLDQASSRLEREIKAAPHDSMLRLRYGEMMFGAGKAEAALAKFDEAIGLLNATSTKAEDARDRIFKTTITLASRSADQSPKTADALFDRADAVAGTPVQRIDYLTSRAKFAAVHHGPPVAIELCQQILTDPQLADVMVSDPVSGDLARAASVAEREIERLIATSGRDSFSRFERMATDRLAAATKAGDADAMSLVAREYPNALTSPVALQRAAEAYVRDGRHHAAAAALRRSLQRATADETKVDLLQAMAQNDLAMPGGIEAAIARLRAVQKRSADALTQRPLRISDQLTIAASTAVKEAIELLEQASRQSIAAQLPDFALPDLTPVMNQPRPSAFDAGRSRTSDGAEALIPVESQNKLETRVVGWSSVQGLSVWSDGLAQTLYRGDAKQSRPVKAFWYGSKLAMQDARSISLISTGRGDVDWKVDLRDAASDDNSPPEQYVAAAFNASRIVAATDRGRIMAVSPDNGTLVWQANLPQDQPIQRLLCSNEFAVVIAADADEIRLIAFDLFDGTVIWQKTFSRNNASAPINFALDDAGLLVYLTNGGMAAKDLLDPTPALLWQWSGPHPLFAGSESEGQLLIHRDQVIALSVNGQFVRVYRTDSGQPWRYKVNDSNAQIGAVLPTGCKSMETKMMKVGDQLYIHDANAIASYNLNKLNQTWRSTSEKNLNASTSHLLIGRRHVVRIGSSSGVSGNDGPVRLQAFSRMMTPNGESGLLVLDEKINDSIDVSSWKGVEGGFIFATTGGIKFLAGASPLGH